MQNFGVTNKEHYMVCYGIFLSGQLRACLHGGGGPQVGEVKK